MSRMIPLKEIDKSKYPTLHKYHSALTKDPKQPKLIPWMVKNKETLDREIKEWSKVWSSKENQAHRLSVYKQRDKLEVK